MRRTLLVGIWVAATVAATVVASAAVRQVTDVVGPPAPLPLPAGASAAPQPTEEAPVRPSASVAPAAAPQRTESYRLVGGAVTVGFRAGATRLVQAAPASGFVVEVRDRGPGKVDVRFTSDRHESRIVVRWRDGRPDVERDERD